MSIVKCLIVDDDPIKQNRIRELIVEELGSQNASTLAVSSSSEAAKLLRRTQYDLLIIDINLPIRENEPPAQDGGVRLLNLVGRGAGGLFRPAFVVGITGYPELEEKSMKHFAIHGWVLLHYSPESSVWEGVLRNQCQHIFSYKERIDASFKAHAADVCILTAISDTELDAVRRQWCDFRTAATSDDTLRYLEGEIPSARGPLRVVAVSATEMGNAAMAVTTTKVLTLFRPKLCILVGICAGIRADIGDIIVADCSLHYESGKYKEGSDGERMFFPEPRYQSASSRIMEAIKRYKLENPAKINEVSANWPGSKPTHSPSIHCGPVASGAAVVENEEIITDLTFRDRKLIALEMESYGFYLACHHSAQPKPEFMMIKAVCDLARPPKTDDFQNYCAFLSSGFAYEFVLSEAALHGGILS